MDLAEVQDQGVQFLVLMFHLSIELVEWEFKLFFSVKDLFNETFAELDITCNVICWELRCHLGRLDRLVAPIGAQFEVFIDFWRGADYKRLEVGHGFFILLFSFVNKPGESLE